MQAVTSETVLLKDPQIAKVTAWKKKHLLCQRGNYNVGKSSSGSLYIGLSVYAQYEQVACNKILILATQKRQNAEQFRHSGFDSLCCICHQTPGKSGLSGLVAVHAYPCIGAKDSVILAWDTLDIQKKCNMVAFPILKWINLAKPFDFF